VAVVRAVQAERPTSDAAAGSTDGVLDVVVVGGGISGLCTAQALVTKHAGAARRVLLTESRDRVGGNITTVSVRRARASRTPACAQARLSCMPALPAPPGTRGRTLRG
jgi:cation diffusion facilitator CzcD-associated flavoprotein CzcO